MERTWSEHQNRIFTFIGDGRGNASIEAVAGSGKTTTIVEAANRLPAGTRNLFLAFNKSIAEELASRLPSHVTSKTLNSLGHGAWAAKLRPMRLTLDANKTRAIMDKRLVEADRKLYGSLVTRLVALAKSAGLAPAGAPNAYPLVDDSLDTWLDMIDYHDLEVPEDGNVNRAIDLARKVLSESIRQAFAGYVDFDDQIYMTVVYRAPMSKFDFVFVDEAQDLNCIQHQLIAMAIRPGAGRLVAVGDPRQAIYGFRGADASSMENLQKRFRTTTLPLSISYRCPQAVVAEAQKIVSHIQSHESAPMGLVETVDKYDASLFDDRDVIVCRNAKPLVALAFQLIRGGRGCRVLGRDIGQGLQSLIKKMNAADVDALETKLDAYLDRETRRLLAKNQDAKVAALEDKVDTVRLFIDQLNEGERTIEALFAKIDALFTDNGAGKLTLCTIHKSKGLEWDRVFILDRELMPSKYARQAWQLAQETNIHYVAITRARRELRYLVSDNFKKGGK